MGKKKKSFQQQVEDNAYAATLLSPLVGGAIAYPIANYYGTNDGTSNWDDKFGEDVEAGKARILRRDRWPGNRTLGEKEAYKYAMPFKEGPGRLLMEHSEPDLFPLFSRKKWIKDTWEPAMKDARAKIHAAHSNIQKNQKAIGQFYKNMKARKEAFDKQNKLYKDLEKTVSNPYLNAPEMEGIEYLDPQQQYTGGVGGMEGVGSWSPELQSQMMENSPELAQVMASKHGGYVPRYYSGLQQLGMGLGALGTASGLGSMVVPNNRARRIMQGVGVGSLLGGIGSFGVDAYKNQAQLDRIANWQPTDEQEQRIAALQAQQPQRPLAPAGQTQYANPAAKAIPQYLGQGGSTPNSTIEMFRNKVQSLIKANKIDKARQYAHEFNEMVNGMTGSDTDHFADMFQPSSESSSSGGKFSPETLEKMSKQLPQSLEYEKQRQQMARSSLTAEEGNPFNDPNISPLAGTTSALTTKKASGGYVPRYFMGTAAAIGGGIKAVQTMKKLLDLYNLKKNGQFTGNILDLLKIKIPGASSSEQVGANFDTAKGIYKDLKNKYNKFRNKETQPSGNGIKYGDIQAEEAMEESNPEAYAAYAEDQMIQEAVRNGTEYMLPKKLRDLLVEKKKKGMISGLEKYKYVYTTPQAQPSLSPQEANDQPAPASASGGYIPRYGGGGLQGWLDYNRLLGGRVKKGQFEGALAAAGVPGARERYQAKYNRSYDSFINDALGGAVSPWMADRLRGLGNTALGYLNTNNRWNNAMDEYGQKAANFMNAGAQRGTAYGDFQNKAGQFMQNWLANFKTQNPGVSLPEQPSYYGPQSETLYNQARGYASDIGNWIKETAGPVFSKFRKIDPNANIAPQQQQPATPVQQQQAAPVQQTAPPVQQAQPVQYPTITNPPGTPNATPRVYPNVPQPVYQNFGKYKEAPDWGKQGVRLGQLQPPGQAPQPIYPITGVGSTGTPAPQPVPQAQPAPTTPTTPAPPIDIPEGNLLPQTQAENKAYGGYVPRYGIGGLGLGALGTAAGLGTLKWDPFKSNKANKIVGGVGTGVGGLYSLWNIYQMAKQKERADYMDAVIRGNAESSRSSRGSSAQGSQPGVISDEEAQAIAQRELDAATQRQEHQTEDSIKEPDPSVTPYNVESMREAAAKNFSQATGTPLGMDVPQQTEYQFDPTKYFGRLEDRDAAFWEGEIARLAPNNPQQQMELRFYLTGSPLARTFRQTQGQTQGQPQVRPQNEIQQIVQQNQDRMAQIREAARQPAGEEVFGSDAWYDARDRRRAAQAAQQRTAQLHPEDAARLQELVGGNTEEFFNRVGGDNPVQQNAYGGYTPRFEGLGRALLLGGYAPRFEEGGMMPQEGEVPPEMMEQQGMEQQMSPEEQQMMMQQQQMQQQPQPQGGTYMPTGVYDPTGTMPPQQQPPQQGQQDPNAAMQQQQMQQQPQSPMGGVDPQIQARIPYYQLMYQKMAQRAASPKGAMKNVVPMKSRT